jgi:hypothetical protein
MNLLIVSISWIQFCNMSSASCSILRKYFYFALKYWMCFLWNKRNIHRKSYLSSCRSWQCDDDNACTCTKMVIGSRTENFAPSQELHCHMRMRYIMKPSTLRWKKIHRDNVDHWGFYRAAHIMTTSSGVPDVLQVSSCNNTSERRFWITTLRKEWFVPTYCLLEFVQLIS